MSALADHMGPGITTVCRAWVLRRVDGRLYGFTDHDRPLTVDGVPCVASSGMAAGALQRATGLSVDNSEAVGALSHDAITEADLRAGKWDDASVTTYLVNWAAPDAFEVLFRGTLGEASWGEGAFSVELRSLSEALNMVQGRVYQARCDAVLGDGRCRRDLSDEIFTVDVLVDAVEDNRVLHLPVLDLYAPKWFERGLVTVLDGASEGASGRVKTDRVKDGMRRVELWSALRDGIEPGNRIRLQAGCDKTHGTCRFKFDNLLNFRGFPNIPGEDWLMAYPTSTSVNDGGKL
ncbi:DUF2163 domain-containing protein [Jannaschia sp. 2305UL9-9]|uniref:DUF2163 domain-containing protein n=1 Tax=Jannaschia sp. 2305UL9-9 TaxID=3121638 RepID=UPI003528DE3E